MNEIIIRNINMPFNIKEFSKEFAKIYVVFLINVFFEYDQMILIEKSENLTIFMTFLNLFRMTRFSQDTINSMTQYI